jgi:iron complex transport system substrate-binding protein
LKKVSCIIVILFLFADVIYAKEYRRIISLAPSITESLYELGLERYVKGVTIYCPKGKTVKKIIGTLLDPDIEKIILLRPDLIIATKDGNNKAIVEKISRFGFEVYIMEASNNFDTLCYNYQKLALKLDRQKEAKDIIDYAKNLLNQIARLKSSNYHKVFWDIGADPLYTAGKLSFLNDYNHYTNTTNIYEDVKKRYFAVDISDVIFRNPDIVLVINTKGVDGKVWNVYETIKAVKNNKVFFIKADDVLLLTPIRFARSVKMLARLLSDAK